MDTEQMVVGPYINEVTRTASDRDQIWHSVVSEELAKCIKVISHEPLMPASNVYRIQSQLLKPVSKAQEAVELHDEETVVM